MGKRSRERDDTGVEDIRDVEGRCSFDGVCAEGFVERLRPTLARVFVDARVDGSSGGGLGPVRDGQCRGTDGVGADEHHQSMVYTTVLDTEAEFSGDRRTTRQVLVKYFTRCWPIISSALCSTLQQQTQ